MIGATVLVWWILSRSTLGFQFRAVGENPNAARVAGIKVSSMYVYGMLISIPVAACLKILLCDVVLPKLEAKAVVRWQS